MTGKQVWIISRAHIGKPKAQCVARLPPGLFGLSDMICNEDD